MDEKERHTIITQIILGNFKGMQIDLLVFNDGYRALEKLSNEELMERLAKLDKKP